MSDRQPLVLIVPSQRHFLCVIRGFIESACRLARLDDKFTQALTLAVHEAAGNVICHAHRNRPDARIHVEFHLLENAVEVQVQDEGEPFDVHSVPHLDPGEVRPGGRGIFLMRALVDELMCCQRRSGGNVLRLVKYRPRGNAPAQDAG